MKTTATIFPILALLLSPFLFGQARSEFEAARSGPQQG
jgi:hypothetical protein